MSTMLQSRCTLFRTPAGCFDPTEPMVFFKNRNGDGSRWEDSGAEGPPAPKGAPGSDGAAGLEPAFLDSLQ